MTYTLSVEEKKAFHEDGFLIVPQLINQENIQELLNHTVGIMQGEVIVPGQIDPPPPDATIEEIEQRYIRIHQLHFHLEIHERYLLHARILDVLEGLIGPDVMAMQTMLFLKAPDQIGQGYHQDSYYIPTRPDTLCGAWIALDDADEENGCVWFVQGTQHEPISHEAQNVSHDDVNLNGLGKIAAKYPDNEVPAVMKSGDVAFFGGHVIHRSHSNKSKTRFRRAFVGHYANARSWTHWGAPLDECRNSNQILARGNTHLPYAVPKFGTMCAATQVN